MSKSLQKVFLLFCFSLIVFSANAKQYKLRYEPKGIIIQFNYDSLKIYTDTTAIFYAFNNPDVYTLHDSTYLRARNLILQRIKETKNDTIVFEGQFITLENSNYWDTSLLIFQLAKEKKMVLFDKADKQVTTIKIKIIGKRDHCCSETVYLNKDTKKELFTDFWICSTCF